MTERQKFDPANPPRKKKTVIIAEDIDGGYELEIETVPSYKIIEIWDLVLMIFEFDLNADVMEQLRGNFGKFPRQFIQAVSILTDQDYEIVKKWDALIIMDVAYEYVVFNIDEIVKRAKKKGEGLYKALGIEETKAPKEIKEESQKPSET